MDIIYLISSYPTQWVLVEILNSVIVILGCLDRTAGVSQSIRSREALHVVIRLQTYPNQNCKTVMTMDRSLEWTLSNQDFSSSCCELSREQLPCNCAFDDGKPSHQCEIPPKDPEDPPPESWWSMGKIALGAAAGGVGLVVAAPIALAGIGFTAGGAAAGSLAAGMMSTAAAANGGAIAAGSVVAICQSVGAAGLGAAGAAAVGSVGAAVGGAAAAVGAKMAKPKDDPPNDKKKTH
ncbi:uncharacterized protein LOC143039957 isoform X1 [Oratosquilla oratoria]|uniref:uncharacterized protein LOC143039957 isoform X1 n=2 Tax=Oratosquilla oratoria TaxID=337810 RepID=UPI003F75CED1